MPPTPSFLRKSSSGMPFERSSVTEPPLAKNSSIANLAIGDRPLEAGCPVDHLHRGTAQLKEAAQFADRPSDAELHDGVTIEADVNLSALERNKSPIGQ